MKQNKNVVNIRDEFSLKKEFHEFNSESIVVAEEDEEEVVIQTMKKNLLSDRIFLSNLISFLSLLFGSIDCERKPHETFHLII